MCIKIPYAHVIMLFNDIGHVSPLLSQIFLQVKLLVWIK